MQQFFVHNNLLVPHFPVQAIMSTQNEKQAGSMMHCSCLGLGRSKPLITSPYSDIDANMAFINFLAETTVWPLTSPGAYQCHCHWQVKWAGAKTIRIQNGRQNIATKLCVADNALMLVSQLTSAQKLFTVLLPFFILGRSLNCALSHVSSKTLWWRIRWIEILMRIKAEF